MLVPSFYWFSPQFYGFPCSMVYTRTITVCIILYSISFSKMQSIIILKFYFVFEFSHLVIHFSQCKILIHVVIELPVWNYLFDLRWKLSTSSKIKLVTKITQMCKIEDTSCWCKIFTINEVFYNFKNCKIWKTFQAYY